MYLMLVKVVIYNRGHDKFILVHQDKEFATDLITHSAQRPSLH